MRICSESVLHPECSRESWKINISKLYCNRKYWFFRILKIFFMFNQIFFELIWDLIFPANPSSLKILGNRLCLMWPMVSLKVLVAKFINNHYQKPELSLSISRPPLRDTWVYHKTRETDQARLGSRIGLFPEISDDLPTNVFLQYAPRQKQICTPSHL